MDTLIYIYIIIYLYISIAWCLQPHKKAITLGKPFYSFIISESLIAILNPKKKVYLHGPTSFFHIKAFGKDNIRWDPNSRACLRVRGKPYNFE